jgi:hypothetical protein
VAPSRPACAYVTPPPGVAGSVGINFVSSDSPDQALVANDIAGIGPEAQANWNTVKAGTTTVDGLITSDGAVSPITLSIRGEAKPETGESWGFKGNDLKLKRGNLASNPRLELKGIPFTTYDVNVILGAGVHSVQGEVSLFALGSDEPTEAFVFNHGWTGGKHKAATTHPGEKADNANLIVFKDVTARDIAIAMKWGGGKGWTGIAAIQIVPRR